MGERGGHGSRRQRQTAGICNHVPTPNDSYGGAVKVSVGIGGRHFITGIEFLDNDTPGLGLRAKEPKFKDQFMGKNASALSVNQDGECGRHQINAIQRCHHYFQRGDAMRSECSFILSA